MLWVKKTSNDSVLTNLDRIKDKKNRSLTETWTLTDKVVETLLMNIDNIKWLGRKQSK